MINTAAMAQDLVALCLTQKNEEAVEKYYAPNVVNVEAQEMPHMPRETQGIKAVREKGKWWYDTFEVRSVKATGPFVAVDRFSVVFEYVIVEKASGKEIRMRENAVYSVKDGKIVRVEFLYLADECGAR